MTANHSRVLIVENNALIASGLADELERRGAYLVDVATTVRGALCAVDNALPAIAIIDWRLGDGETCGQLSIALARSGVKVCILSGHDTPERAALGVPHTFICKPAPAGIIADLVDRYACMDHPARRPAFLQ